MALLVLESIVRAGFARKHPIAMLLDAIILCSVGIYIGLSTFPDAASVLSIAFITAGIIPVLHTIFVREEKEEAKKPGAAVTFIERHFDIIMVYSWFFIGLIIAFAFWYGFLPESQRKLAFAEQEKAFSDISNLRAAKATQSLGLVGACNSKSMAELALNCIYKNNAMVLAWAILFSVVYGAGAIFLIGWNASVIGLVIGKEFLVKDAVSATMRAIGLLPHGIPEIIAYFIGAIAGGIISVGITKKKYASHEFQTIFKDSAVLIVTAFIVLFAAAIIEAYLILGA